MKRMEDFKVFYIIAVLVFFSIFCSGTIQALDLPKMIDKTNCAQYKDLLIPAMYRAVERGDMIVMPGTINFKYKHMNSFIAASARNEGKFDVTPNGDLIDKCTGKYLRLSFSHH